MATSLLNKYSDKATHHQNTANTFAIARLHGVCALCAIFTLAFSVAELPCNSSCMSLHHGLADLRDNYGTCFSDLLWSFVISGILPSQLEILSMGRTYFEILPVAAEEEDTYRRFR